MRTLEGRKPEKKNISSDNFTLRVLTKHIVHDFVFNNVVMIIVKDKLDDQTSSICIRPGTQVLSVPNSSTNILPRYRKHE